MRKITLVDMYRTGAPEGGVPAVAGPIQKQISEDFAPAWGIDARLRVVRLPDPAQDPDTAQTLRHADGVLYVSPETGPDSRGLTNAVAYHLENHAGIPCGFVFPEITRGSGQPWSVAASHEILEMLVDPDLNQMVGAPHPLRPKETVLRPREVCDPVQAHGYEIDGVRVADFVTRQYFTTRTRHPEQQQPTHYLGNPKLDPFGLLPGGSYVYFDLDTRRWHQLPDLKDPINDKDEARRWADARWKGVASRGFRRLRVAFDSIAGGGFPSDPTVPGGGLSNGGCSNTGDCW